MRRNVSDAKQYVLERTFESVENDFEEDMGVIKIYVYVPGLRILVYTKFVSQFNGRLHTGSSFGALTLKTM